MTTNTQFLWRAVRGGKRKLTGRGRKGMQDDSYGDGFFTLAYSMYEMPMLRGNCSSSCTSCECEESILAFLGPAPAPGEGARCRFAPAAGFPIEGSASTIIFLDSSLSSSQPLILARSCAQSTLCAPQLKHSVCCRLPVRMC